MCGRLLCGGINAFLDVAVIFTTERKRIVVLFLYIFILLGKFSKKKKENSYCSFFQTVFCFCALITIFYFIIRL